MVDGVRACARAGVGGGRKLGGGGVSYLEVVDALAQPLQLMLRRVDHRTAVAVVRRRRPAAAGPLGGDEAVAGEGALRRHVRVRLVLRRRRARPGALRRVAAAVVVVGDRADRRRPVVRRLLVVRLLMLRVLRRRRRRRPLLLVRASVLPRADVLLRRNGSGGLLVRGLRLVGARTGHPGPAPRGAAPHPLPAAGCCGLLLSPGRRRASAGAGAARAAVAELHVGPTPLWVHTPIVLHCLASGCCFADWGGSGVRRKNKKYGRKRKQHTPHTTQRPR